MITLDELKAKLSVAMKVLHCSASLEPNGKSDEMVAFMRFVFGDARTVKEFYDVWLRAQKKRDAA